MNRKTMVVPFLLFAFVIFFLSINDTMILNKKYLLTSSNLPKKIELLIPFMKRKIRIDMVSKNNLCQKSIHDKKIFLNILYANKKISLAEMNALGYGTFVKLVFDKKKNISINCDISIAISDPYGNMNKELLFIVFPILVILYLLFKTGWLYVAKKIKYRRRLSRNNL